MNQDYKIYIHRERGFVYLPIFKNKSSSEILNMNIKDFCFIPNRKYANDKFGRKISISTLDEKVFAGMNLRNGKIFFDTKLGIQKMLDRLIHSLCEAEYKIDCPKVRYGYVEVCARFPWEKIKEAHELIETIAITFRTRKTNITIKKHDSLDLDWLYLVKNVLFGKYIVNVKIYLAVKYANGKYNNNRITNFDYNRLPKIEVQIAKPGNLNMVIEETVSIITAFLDMISCQGKEMTEEDYEVVRFSKRGIKGYQQIYSQLQYFSKKERVYFIDLSKDSKYARKIISMLHEKPRSVREIRAELKVSENTVRKQLKRLMDQEIIYFRGRSGIESMYAIMLQPEEYNRPL